MQELIALDWVEILEKIQSFSTSESGKARAKDLKPLPGPTEAGESFREIFEASQVLGQGVRPFMQSLDLFSIWFPRLKKKSVVEGFRNQRRS